MGRSHSRSCSGKARPLRYPRSVRNHADAESGAVAANPGEPRATGAPPPDGTLLLIGGSELFKNHRLRTPEFRADHLLLSAVATLALDDELASLAARRSVARGFGRVEPSSRLWWRAGVIGTPVLLVLGLVLVRRTGSRVHARVTAAR